MVRYQACGGLFVIAAPSMTCRNLGSLTSVSATCGTFGACVNGVMLDIFFVTIDSPVTKKMSNMTPLTHAPNGVMLDIFFVTIDSPVLIPRRFKARGGPK